MVSETRRLAMRRAHSKRAYHCTCGMIVHGNGASSAHRAMHMRKNEWRSEEGHHYMTESERERRRASSALSPGVRP